MGSGEEAFTNIAALCSSAALFHWFTGVEWPKLTASQLANDEPRFSTTKTSGLNQTALKNSGKSLLQNSILYIYIYIQGVHQLYLEMIKI